LKKQLFLFTLILVSINSLTTCWGQLKSGKWIGTLELQTGLFLPFDFEKIEGNGNQYYIHNSTESIQMDIIFETADTLILAFPNFKSNLYLIKQNKRTLSGYWLNFNKGNDYKIPCVIRYESNKNNGDYKKSTVFNSNHVMPEKWEVTFDNGSGSTDKAIGLFHQGQQQKLTGTFATETGDYRFLEGKLFKDSLILSCFDGAHAFLFLGKLNSSTTIDGTFYSGKHWSTKWNSVVNNSFELNHPDSITYLVDPSEFTFSSYHLDSTLFNFSAANNINKVTIIQLMGTWCPNCMDESRYLQDLYAKYHSEGLNIIAVAYEIENSFSNYKKNIERFKDKNGIEYLITIGGKASKDLASKQFPNLNKISAFPTSIVLDKNGTVRNIHTGFYGPGTGIYYENYSEKMENFILQLLSE
jgi:thiol-disulfide isomerase/thioredoxin